MKPYKLCRREQRKSQDRDHLEQEKIITSCGSLHSDVSSELPSFVEGMQEYVKN